MGNRSRPAAVAHVLSILGMACWVALGWLVAWNPAVGATAVDARKYKVLIEHQVISQTLLDDGRVVLGLELKLHNDSPHDLYDLRLFLARAEPAELLPECEPAHLQVLAAGTSQMLAWDFECLISPLPAPSSRELQFRIEAVDQGKKEIVTFTRASAAVH